MIVPNLTSKGEEAKIKIVCINMKNIYNTMLDSFKIDNGMYPSTEEGLLLLIKNTDEEKYPNYAKSGYLKDPKIPKDSWGSEFIYINDEGSIELISLGADRKEGGKDEFSDIKMSECK
ncbi:MAG: type II secretion system protein GspG [Sulfurimonas sp.]|nr:type II secretion system protein GspG [Sulfurimonas sp.]